MQLGLRKNWKWDSHLYSTLSSSGVDLDPGSYQALCYVIRFLGNMERQCTLPGSWWQPNSNVLLDVESFSFVTMILNTEMVFLNTQLEYYLTFFQFC
jgi:hypothetical protein